MQFHELEGLCYDDLTADELRACLNRIQGLKKKDPGQVSEDSVLGRPEYQGYIYILSNEAMPGLLKIGFTETLVEERAAVLSAHSGVPMPFKPEWRCPVYKHPKHIEEAVHKALDIFRFRPNREFFRLNLKRAIPIVSVAIASVDPIAGEKINSVPGCLKSPSRDVLSNTSDGK